MAGESDNGSDAEHVADARAPLFGTWGRWYALISDKREQARFFDLNTAKEVFASDDILGAAFGAFSALAYRKLSPALEPPPATRAPPLQKSRGVVLQLAALFSVDSFGGGFVVQSILALWLFRRFDVPVSQAGAIFFAVNVLGAFSQLVSARMAARIGHVRTMVYTHLPSNVFLVAVPFVPSLGGAIALLLARFALSQMDVPTRQAYVVSMVDSRERTAAAAYTNTSRYAARPFGPAIGGVLMQHALAGPWVAAGGLKIAYDAALFVLFRRVPLASEQPSSERSASEESSSSAPAVSERRGAEREREP